MECKRFDLEGEAVPFPVELQKEEAVRLRGHMHLDDPVVGIWEPLQISLPVGFLQIHVSFFQLQIGIPVGDLFHLRAHRDAAVHPQITLGAPVPAEVLFHTPAPEQAEGFLITEVNPQRCHDTHHQALPGIFRKGESVADAVKITVCPYRILQAPGFMNDRDRPIPHGHHLAQPAGLKAGRHQVEVGSGKHLCRHVLAVVAGEPELAGPPLNVIVEFVDVCLIPLSENNHLASQVHQPRQDILDQFHALLFNQPCHQGKQREMRLLLQAEGFLDFCLAGSFSGHVVRVEGRRQPGILPGIIVVHVDAVEDSLQLIIHEVSHALQPHAVPVMMQFSCIGGRHGGNRIRNHHRAFHQIYVVPAFIFETQPAVIPACRQVESGLQFPAAELALISDIVNRKDAPDILQLRPCHLIILQINRGQCRFPVVAVQDLRQGAQLRQQFDHRPAEKGKPHFVSVISIQAGPVKEGIISQEPDRYAIPLSPVQFAAVIRTAVRDVHIHHKLDLLLKPLPYALIQWGQDRHVIPGLLQRWRQRESHIRQAAAFAERRAFTRHKKNSHIRYPPGTVFLFFTLSYPCGNVNTRLPSCRF